MHSWRCALLAALALAALATGCAGKGDEPPEATVALTGPTNVVAVGAADRLPARTGTVLARAADDVGDPPRAADAAAALKRYVRAIGEVEAVSESEARFVDTRLAGPDAKPDGKNGGTIEIKATPAEARRGPGGPPVLSALLPAPADYRFAQGRILLRLSSRLTPDAADRYAAALSRLRG
ncbi:MAG TPA: hypothetical protein VK066_09370 [Chloroflexota bacterium]|nr:hypothetical protein [Chloroflexota bacterium]